MKRPIESNFEEEVTSSENENLVCLWTSVSSIPLFPHLIGQEEIKDEYRGCVAERWEAIYPTTCTRISTVKDKSPRLLIHSQYRSGSRDGRTFVGKWLSTLVMKLYSAKRTISASGLIVALRLRAVVGPTSSQRSLSLGEDVNTMRQVNVGQRQTLSRSAQKVCIPFRHFPPPNIWGMIHMII